MTYTPYYDRAGVTLYHGDALDVLPSLSVNASMVITDPPYITGVASFGENTCASGWGDVMHSAGFYAQVLGESKRLTAQEQGCAWIFNSWRSMPIMARASYLAQWAITSMLIWDKEWIGASGPRGLRSSYEMAALFCHAEFTIKDRSLPDIWRCKWHSHKPHGHPAEKPRALIERMIQAAGGGLVIDPFCGSGTTLDAAQSVGVPAIGIEIEERWCEVAARRLDQGSLFA